MRLNCCNTFLASLLKFLNYLQAFVAISVVLYSVWILNHWNLHPLHKSNTPWFAYAVMAVGALLCLIALAGYIATTVVAGCCLCFYAIFISILILIEAVLVADLAFNKHWEEDLPDDATGELKSLRAFIEANIDIFKWGTVTVVVVQALSLLLAIILRSMVPPRRLDYESGDDVIAVRKPLLNSQGVLASTSSSVDSTGIQSDTWSSRMRHKYGLVPEPLSNGASHQKASPSLTGSSSDDRRCCSIL